MNDFSIQRYLFAFDTLINEWWCPIFLPAFLSKDKMINFPCLLLIKA